MKEEWKQIENFPLYEVSSIGNVRRMTRGKYRYLRPHLNDNGYYEVALSINGIVKHQRIHRLVALCFVPNPNHEPQVDHIDGCKTNNSVENLRWVSPSVNVHNPNTFENMRRRTRKLRPATIKRCGKTVTTEEIKAIKAGSTEAFNCDGDKMYAVAVVLSTLKRRGLPEGVVDYEHKKFFDKNIIVIRALREGDVAVLNR